MVHLNGFLDEEDIADQKELEGGSETEGAPSVSDSILGYGEGMETDTGSQHSRSAVDQMDSQSNQSLHAPSSAASHLSHRSLGMFSQSVRLNSEVGSSSLGPTVLTPGRPGYGILARQTLGVITEVKSPRDEAREKSLAETMESLIGKPPQSDENTITLGLVGFTLAQGVYHPPSPWSVKEAHQFMATHLNSDLRQENFLSEYEKLPQLQQIFDF